MTNPSFAEKRNQWLDILRGDDTNTIDKQLTRICWDAATFTVINKARELAPSDNDGIHLNGLIHSAINTWFATSQMTAVRRLVDDFSFEGKKGVYSLVGILKDMCKNQYLFTREAILDAEDLTYDYEPLKEKTDESIRNAIRSGVKKSGFMPVSRSSEGRHCEIDELVGCCKAMRTPSDVIPTKVFGNLICKAEKASESIKAHVNKFIAHAATLESRDRDGLPEISVTWDQLDQSYASLCQVAGFIAVCLLGDYCPGYLPHPIYDFLKYMECSLVSSGLKPQLEYAWNAFEKECASWTNWSVADYNTEMDYDDNSVADGCQ